MHKTFIKWGSLFGKNTSPLSLLLLYACISYLLIFDFMKDAYKKENINMLMKKYISEYVMLLLFSQKVRQKFQINS